MIIIIANQPEQVVAPPDLTTQRPGPVPPSEPAVAPLVPTRQPPLISPPRKMREEQDPVVQEELRNNLQTALQDYKVTGNEDIIQQIYRMPYGKGTVGDWLKGVLLFSAKGKRKYEPIEVQNEVYKAIWDSLRILKDKPDAPTNMTGHLRETLLSNLKHDIRSDMTGMKDQRLNEGYSKLRDYMAWLKDPSAASSKGKSAKRIEPDLLHEVDSGIMEPYEAAYEQYKRDAWFNNIDPTACPNLDVNCPKLPPGTSRVDIAKQKFDELFEATKMPQKRELEKELADFNAKVQAKQISSKSFERALNSIKNRYGDFMVESLDPIKVRIKPVDGAQEFNNTLKQLGENAKIFAPGSPYWLTGEMIQPRILPSMLPIMWQMNSGGDVGIDVGQDDAGGFIPEQGSDYREFQQRGVPKQQEARDQAIEQTFNDALNSIEDPQERALIEPKVPAVLPFRKTTDPSGKTTFEANPNFKPTVEHILNKLYGQDSIPRMLNNDEDDQTKRFLYEIGQRYANSFEPTNSISEPSLRREFEGLMEPMKFLYFPDVQADTFEQAEAMGVREVMMDILHYLKYNDKVIQQQFGQKAVAATKQLLRTAAFLTINRIISREE